MKKNRIAAVMAFVIAAGSAASSCVQYTTSAFAEEYAVSELAAAAAQSYISPVCLMKADNSGSTSMGNAALVQSAQLMKQDDGSVVAVLEFQSMTYLGQDGYLGFLKRYDESGSNLVEASVLEKYDGVLDQFNDPDSDNYDSNLGDDDNIFYYPKKVSIPVTAKFDASGNIIGIEETDVKVQVYVPVMESIGDGGGTQDAVLHFQDAILAGSSVSLAGDIRLNSYLNFSDSFITDSNAKVVISTPDGRSDTTPMSRILSSQTEQGYVVSTAIPAKDIGTTLTGQIINGAGEVVDEFETSVKSYATSLNKDTSGAYSDAQKEMAVALLNYGAFSQGYFKYNTGNLANSGLASKNKTKITSVTADDFSSYGYTSSGSVSGITYSGSCLSLLSQTAVKHYFTLDSSKNISDYTFTANGKTVTPVKDGDKYYVTVSGISAQNLDEKYAVTVKGGGSTFTLNYSVLDYCKLVLNSEDTSTPLQSTSKALYLLWQAAEALS